MEIKHMRSYGSSIFKLLKKLYNFFSIMVVQIYIPTNTVQVVTFLHTVTNTYLLLISFW